MRNNLEFQVFSISNCSNEKYFLNIITSLFKIIKNLLNKLFIQQ
jgi:hypothetical protein